MKIFNIFAIAALASTATLTMANEKVITENGIATFSTFKPAAVRLEAGTTGYGGAISWNANPYVGVTLGYNGGDISWSDDVTINGTEYDLEMDNNNVYLNAEIRPFANWLYVAAGVAYLDNDYDVLGKVSTANDTIKLDGWNFNGPGRVTGKVSYDDNIVPYLGIGFSPAITNRFGVFGEIGAYYTGNPDVKLRATPGLTAIDPNGPSVYEALRAEEKSIREDDKFKWLPVAKLGLSVRF